jgi:hypothetical protein
VSVNYIKTEKLTNYTDFDWLITADRFSLDKAKYFEVAEVIPSFKKISFSKAKGVVAELENNALFILKRKRKL